jgi:hypothetical protein
MFGRAKDNSSTSPWQNPINKSNPGKEVPKTFLDRVAKAAA